MPKRALNSNNLKEVLWETIEGVRSGKINVSQANAISSSARTICSVVNLELQMSKAIGAKPNVKTTKFIESK